MSLRGDHTYLGSRDRAHGPLTLGGTEVLKKIRWVVCTHLGELDIVILANHTFLSKGISKSALPYRRSVPTVSIHNYMSSYILHYI